MLHPPLEKRRVEALDKGDRPGVCELHGAQAQPAFGAPLVAATHHEGAEDG